MKRGIRYMWITVLILAAVLAAALATLLATPLGDRPLAALFPVGAVAPVDFAAPGLSDPPRLRTSALNIEAQKRGGLSVYRTRIVDILRGAQE